MDDDLAELHDLIRWLITALDLKEGESYGETGWLGACAEGWEWEETLIDPPPPHPELLRAIVAELEAEADARQQHAERDQRARQWIR